MAKITFLGTANAVPDRDHQNTHFTIESGERIVLVDCPGNPVVRLGQANIDPLLITDLVLTHFHPDHVSGLPLLLMNLWLMGKKSHLSVYGLPEVLDKCKKMMALYNWEDWEEFFPLSFYEVPLKEGSLILESTDINIWSSPVHHRIPAIGLKASFHGGSICYSGDTAPCDEVIRLARGTNLLIHEATGDEQGHSSPSDAGRIAQAAGVETLYLIHYPLNIDPLLLVQQAKDQFSGSVYNAEDLMIVEI
jgi:ribonuclease Z